MSREEAIKQLELYRACMSADGADVEAYNMAIEALEQEPILDKSCKTCMSKDELNKITEWLISHIFRNSDIMFNDEIRGDADGSEEEDLCYIIASLHNMLYKEVTGQYYDYMFHWANKVGAWVYDDLFKEECEKHERY